MNPVSYLSDPAHWTGPDNIGDLLLQHLAYIGAAVALAAVIAIPLGLLLGRSGPGAFLATGLRGGARAVPAVALLFLAVLLLGTGAVNVTLMLALLALPAILTATVVGVRAVDPRTVVSARALGLTEGQVVARVLGPLALPAVVGGLRRAVVQAVATATIVAFVGGGGLGRLLVRGQSAQDYPQLFGGAVLIAALAVVLQLLLTGLGRLAARPTRPRSQREQPADLAVAAV